MAPHILFKQRTSSKEVVERNDSEGAHKEAKRRIHANGQKEVPTRQMPGVNLRGLEAFPRLQAQPFPDTADCRLKKAGLEANTCDGRPYIIVDSIV